MKKLLRITFKKIPLLIVASFVLLILDIMFSALKFYAGARACFILMLTCIFLSVCLIFAAVGIMFLAILIHDIKENGVKKALLPVIGRFAVFSAVIMLFVPISSIFWHPIILGTVGTTGFYLNESNRAKKYLSEDPA